MEEENEFVLPGAVGSNQGKSKPLQEKELAEEDDSTLLEKVQEIPSDLIDAATGEGQEIEFPEIPEASDMGGDAPGLIEGLIPNIKIFLARDDVGKSEIMEKSFKGDERWGGRFQDKFGNPMIVWNGQPYYVNKPGFSSQDFGSSEYVKFESLL